MKNIINRLIEHQPLERDEARRLLINIAEGKYHDFQIASLITIFLMRSISVDEIMGFQEALTAISEPIDLSDFSYIDIVGTGGDGKNTFNISTAACFVVAGAGYPVVKHGNYGATSISGSSNVIEQQGVRFTTDTDIHKKSLEQSRMVFLHAPLFNPALKAVAPVRKNLGIRSFFNVLGPLVNPAKPPFQLLGVYNLSLLRLYSYVYQTANIQYGVVHSLDGYDEISLTSEFKVVTSSGEKIYTPEQLHLQRCQQNELAGGDTPLKAAEVFRSVLKGEAGEAKQNSVLANAAFAIQVMCPEKSIETCLDEAKNTIQSGKAWETFKTFVEINS